MKKLIAKATIFTVLLVTVPQAITVPAQAQTPPPACVAANNCPAGSTFMTDGFTELAYTVVAGVITFVGWFLGGSSSVSRPQGQ